MFSNISNATNRPLKHVSNISLIGFHMTVSVYTHIG